MKRQDLTYKHLSEPGWKTMATKHKVSDIGLSKALADCAKYADKDDHDGVLKSLTQANDYAKKLRTSKDISSKREVCSYLENISKEIEKSRTSVEAYKKDSAEEDKSEVAEKKYLKLICADLVAGLAKAKTEECSVLVCVAAPIYGLTVTTRLTSTHKTNLTSYTESSKFLPAGRCIWDAEKSVYLFVMQKRDAALEAQLAISINHFARQKVKVKVISDKDYEVYQSASAEEESESSTTNDSEEDEGSSSASEEPLNEGEVRETSGPDEEEPLLTGVRPFDISGSVGQGGKNAADDVTQVQIALNRKGASLTVDGKIGSKTIAAIRVFQKKIGLPYPDGLVEVGKRTATALAGGGSGAKPGGYGGGGGKSYAGGGTGKSYGGNGGSGGYGGGSSKNYGSSGGGNKPYGSSGGDGSYGGSSKGYGGGDGSKAYGSSGGDASYGGGGKNYGGGDGSYGGQKNYGGAEKPAYQGGGFQSGNANAPRGEDSPGISETREDGIEDRLREAADNVYEQRKAQAEQKVNQGIDALEDALLPDNNVVGESNPTEG